MTLEQRFMGLADRTRLRILNLLFQGELCGCDIQYVLHSSQSSVSRHLGYLKRTGLVLDRRDGYRVYYRLASLDSSGSRLLDYLRFAFSHDGTFGGDVKSLKAAISEGACTVSQAKAPPARTTPLSRTRARRAG
jgi:ArsR family transcriptional regulator, arsenate/arsenite/antimonite-responsive transcriptional repressor